MRTGWPSAEKISARECESEAGSPSRDSKNAIAWPAPRTPPACSMPFTSSSSPAMPQMRCVAASSKTRPVTAHAQATPSTQVRNLLRASRDRLTKHQQERLRAAFTADKAHISVEVAYHCAQQVRDVFHQTTPAQGRRLLTPHPAPTNVSHPRNRPTRGEPYASGRTHSTPTSTHPEPATHPTEAINGIIKLGRHTARGYRNPTNYQPRMLLIAGGLDAPTHTHSEEPVRLTGHVSIERSHH